jgi:putative ABC transport system ATP-binding protein
MSISNTLYKITDLNLTYKRKGKVNHVLQNINLELPKTGLICLSGTSGSGKSSLMYVLSGLKKQSDGSITYLNTHDYINEDIRYRDTSFILQNYALISYLTVKENILISLKDKVIHEQELLILANILGIEPLLNRMPKELSGGQKQRVAIARALLKRPKVIFADEPTSALDPENSIKVINFLKEASKYSLVLLVTHDHTLIPMVDQVININSGKIIQP